MLNWKRSSEKIKKKLSKSGKAGRNLPAFCFVVLLMGWIIQIVIIVCKKQSEKQP